MKSTKKITHADVIKWVNESSLDLPDQWETIRQNLNHQIPENVRKMDESEPINQSQLCKGRRLLLAGICFAAMVLLISGIVFGLWGSVLFSSKNPNNKYQPMASESVESDDSNGATINQTWSTVLDDPALLSFQNRVVEQVKIMDRENIPEQYVYYAGRFIKDQKTFFVAVTCDPEDFIETYADKLDFSFIQVRQFKYSYKELAEARSLLNEEWIKSDRLINMGIIGHGVDEENNVVLITVLDINDEIRSEISKLISDSGMVEFEVGGEIIPY